MGTPAIPGIPGQDEDASSDALLGRLLVPRNETRKTGAEPTAAPDPDTLADDPLARVQAASNPLLEAARPLLRALAEMPLLATTRSCEYGLDALRQTLIRDLHQFQSLCDRAGFRREQVVATRYCLCTALDEAANRIAASSAGSRNYGGYGTAAYSESFKDSASLDGTGNTANSGGDWASGSLLLLFHNETNGGEKFFLLLGHMVQSPREHLPVLEVLYQILSLGFEGRYALTADGPRQLETIHRHLLAVLAEHAESVPPELSPHWRGVSGGRIRFMRTVPVWVTGCVFTLLLLALFTSLKGDLTPTATALATRIHGLADTPASPAPPAWRDELPLELWFTAAETRRFGIVVDVASETLRLPGNLTFANGTDLKPEVKPVLDILGARLASSRRSAVLSGHTDNTRLRVGSVFRDNKHLSEARAETVLRELVIRGVDPARLSAVGKSDTVPLGDNATSSGRAVNRRVELTLMPQEVR